MSYGIIRLSSVTYAIRAQSVLEKRGIRSVVKRVSRNAKISGCGYGVEIHGDIYAAHQILLDAGIRVIEVIPPGTP